MNSPSIDDLLERLCSGDAEAAEQVFLAFQPYLRKVVRQDLPDRFRAKFDSADVVQSAWVQLLKGFRESGWRFADTAHLRAFLLTVTRHRLTDRLRRHQTALTAERPLLASAAESSLPSSQPRPSEVAQADELWERLLALCPPAHHELLRLKRQGLRLAEIAARTGMHQDSVRRVLRKLAQQLASEQVHAGASCQNGS
jgi:RNA polymerase sigma-70 factor (ECF subfamily)